MYMFQIICNGKDVTSSDFEYETEYEAKFNGEQMADDMIADGRLLEIDEVEVVTAEE